MILSVAHQLWDNSRMRRVELTLPTTAENLALDEALLEWAEDENPAWEFLRIWESRQPLVVVGRSTRVPLEVDEAACRNRELPILRRSSGGASIVAGPGCLMYAVVLSYSRRPELKDIRRAHAFVLGRIADALQRATDHSHLIKHEGTSDLTIADSAAASLSRKFSGNSLRAKRTHLLYHGTLLYDFDLPLIGSLLRTAPRQPEYRGQRTHAEFVTNLPLPRQAIVAALDVAWPTDARVEEWPQSRVAALVVERFGRDEWNLEFPRAP